MINFNQKLNDISHKNDSLVCVGLDIDKEKMPDFLFESKKKPYLEFNKSIIDSTKDLVCAYKLNMAFYEVLGLSGFEILKKTIEYIPKDIIVILDGKRNDIGNTAKKYAQFFFELLSADATTINPYLGEEGIKPFLEYKNKCSFILCRTSNYSARDFQDLKVGKTPFYEIVANKIKKWNIDSNCGVVVGATYPQELRDIRAILGDDVPFLIPGVGKQGGDVRKSVKNGVNSDGKMAIINSSRAIIFAGKNEDFADYSRLVTDQLRNEINKFR